MSMTREQIYQLSHEHFSFEGTEDIQGVLASLAPGVEHEIVPLPVRALKDHSRVRAYYEMAV